MIIPLKSPGAAAGPSRLADWLELKALFSADRNASSQDLVAELRRDGSVDAMIDVNNESGMTNFNDESPELIAKDAFLEIEDRSKAAGAGYPFAVVDQYIELDLSSDVALNTYLFLLALSNYGIDAGKGPNIYPERDFEDISLEAAKKYFGSNPHDGSYLFAFPRRTDERSFAEAVEELARLLNEGGGARNSPLVDQQKDAHLDLVVWHGFADRRAGQLIAFGQCTTNKEWKDKVTNLPPTEAWCRAWMIESPAVSPVRMFFIPHRPDESQWNTVAIFGGILFDRCRIAYHIPILPDRVTATCAKWMNIALKASDYEL